MVKTMVHAPHTSDRARPAGAASETNASLCRYSGHRFIVAPGLAESRGGLVAASLAVAARKLLRCRADSVEAFARGGVRLSSESGWAPGGLAAKALFNDTLQQSEAYSRVPRTQRMVGDIVMALALHK